MLINLALYVYSIQALAIQSQLGLQGTKPLVRYTHTISINKRTSGCSPPPPSPVFLANDNFHFFPDRVIFGISPKYRVSQETWQLVNGFECLLPYTVLDIKDFMQFISLKKTFYSNIFYFKISFTIKWLPSSIWYI